MPEIAFLLDKENSLKDDMVVIRLVEAEKTGYSYTLQSSNKTYSTAQLRKLALPQELNVINALIQEEMKYQKKSTESALSLSTIHLPYAKAIPLFKQLAVTSKFFYNHKALVCDFFGKHTFYFSVVAESPGKVLVTGRIHSHDHDFDVRDCDWVCPGAPHWFIKGISLKLIATDISRNELLQTLTPLPKTATPTLIEDLTDHEPNSPKVVFQEGIQEAVSFHTHQAGPLPVLRLKDRTGAFADLYMQYPEASEVSMQNPMPQFFNLEGKPIGKRQNAAEKSWENDLLETGFLKKAVNTSHYYCPVDKVGKSLAFLLELGWQVFDWQARKIHLQTDTQLKSEHTSEAIVIKGRFTFDHYEADLKDVVGAFNRRERFVLLAENTVGLLPDLNESPLHHTILEGELYAEGIKIPKSKIGSLDDLMSSGAIKEIDASLQNLHQKLANFKEISLALPGERFNGQLRPYQQAGVNWLSFLHNFGFHGLLADDMGLGKTVQVLAFLSRFTLEKPVLIVLPTSLIFNWKQEVRQFLPSATVLILHGPQRPHTMSQLNKPHIILTSYATLRLDLPLLQQIDFEAVILDEAQMIKNAHTQAAQAACSLSANFRLSITGTPIENNLKELWSHFKFLMPDLLGDEKTFLGDLQASLVDPRYLQRIKKKIRPFILRRRKEEVAKDLPEKMEQIVWVEMTVEQKEFYDSFLSGIRSNLLKKINAEGLGKHKIEVFEAILRLRQICCHPQLMAEKIGQDFGQMESAKLQALLEDMETVKQEGCKALVYSQFTQMLHLIAKEAKHRGWKFSYLDGSTHDREKVVHDFQTNEEISFFLISLKAGGTGLNLTAADYVFIFDPWWNEAVENQAIGRAHRIGRQEHVVAKRYVTIESIEEKMIRLKEGKRALAEELLSDEISQAALTLEDFHYLIS